MLPDTTPACSGLKQGSKQMFSFQTFTSSLRRYIITQSGTTAITFALSIVPVLLAAGAAVDYTRYSDARTKIQVALDAGALAIASSANLSKTQRLKAGEDSFALNLTSVNIDPSAVTATGRSGSIHVPRSPGMASSRRVGRPRRSTAR